MAFEAAQGFAPGLALGLLSLEELPGGRMDPALADRDPVQGAVELAVAAAVEAVAGVLARGGGDRGDAGQAGELRIRAQPLCPRGLGDQLRGGESAAALQLQ